MLTDTHAHLYWDSYKDDLEEVLKRAGDTGITNIINVGVDSEKSKVALEQLDQLSSISPVIFFYSSIGIHPHEALKFSTDESIHNELTKLEDIYNSNPQKVVAVGEVGLDYFFENNPDFKPSSISTEETKNLQRKLFKKQVELAKKLDLPLLIHVRDDRSQNPLNTECWDEALQMLSSSKGILHCYSGLEETLKKALQTNFLISFAANITYPKNGYLREAAKLTPLDKICLETDSPFLAPQSKRGQRNEPSSVLEIANLIAEIKGVSLEEVSNQTTQNVKKLFRL